MNPSSRDGWPQSQPSGNANAPQNSSDGQSQSSRPLGGFGQVLPSFSLSQRAEMPSRPVLINLSRLSNPPQPPQQPPQPSSAPPTGPVLPPPSGASSSRGFQAGIHPLILSLGAFLSSNPPSNHSLPVLAGLTGSSSSTGPGRYQAPTQDPPTAQSSHQAPQPGSFPLPGVNQAVHGQHTLQPHPGMEQDREMREPRDAGSLESMAARRDAEQREREAREQQHREQQPHETHTGSVHLHQPVAVAPSVRAIHGPNGLLGNPGVSSAPSLLSAPVGAFHQTDGSQRLQQQQQQQQPPPPPAPAPPAQHNLMEAFPGGAGNLAPTGIAQAAQQPILNVSSFQTLRNSPDKGLQDALSYLDQVKVQFADHPDVYNRFLDIMKDFKSGAIDTPGVIERVSQLFAGNPGLIQGFNTFLPPGYKIECGAGDDPNTIRVTTPMGTTLSTMPPARPLSNPRAHVVNGNVQAGPRSYYPDGITWSSQRTQEAAFGSDGRSVGQPGFGLQSAPTSHPMSPEVQREHTLGGLAHQQDQRGVSQVQNTATVGAGMQMGNRPGVLSSPGDANPPVAQGMNGAGAAMQPSASNGGIEKRGPVEFNHAISYVNKIKVCIDLVETGPITGLGSQISNVSGLTSWQNRFHAEPDIYKQFLEILQTYQRESKPIQEVYAQVTRLFKDAQDLLEDFKQFLPESAAQAKATAARTAGEEAFPISSTRTEPGYIGAAATQTHLHQTPRSDQPRLPPMGNFAPTPSTNRDNKRKRGEKQQATAVTPTMQTDGMGPRAGAAQNNLISKVR